MTTYKIPFFGLKRQYATLRSELLDITDSVLSTGQVLDGEQVTKFERQIALRTQRKFAVAVNSCSQALTFASVALPSRGNVVIPDISFPATLNAALIANKFAQQSDRNVICSDVDCNGLLDLYKLSTKDNNITQIVYVNLFGNVIDYNKLQVITKFFDQKITIIEDAAQSFGAWYNDTPSGKLGDVSCLSFDPTKNLPNYGSGGMLLTDNWEIYNSVLDFRDNGKSNDFSYPGTNSRMSEVDAAQMLVKLRYFDQWQERRADIANYYSDQLSDLVRVPVPSPGVRHAWSKYVIHIPDREKLESHLTSAGIETRVHYKYPLHILDSASNTLANDALPMAMSFSETALSLPMFPELTDSEAEAVVASIKTFYLR